VIRLRPVPLPDSGAVRVHPAPEALPQLRHEGAGRNRFDDPRGGFLMRYTAENLRGCLVETMARFRPNPAADALLAAVEFVDADDDPVSPMVQAVEDWLAEQRVGQVTLVTPQPLLVDIEAADLLVDLDMHPLIREAIDNSPLRDGPAPVHLDAGLIGWAGTSAVQSRRPPIAHCMSCTQRWTVSLTGPGSIPASGAGQFTVTYRLMYRSQICPPRTRSTVVPFKRWRIYWESHCRQSGGSTRAFVFSDSVAQIRRAIGGVLPRQRRAGFRSPGPLATPRRASDACSGTHPTRRVGAPAPCW
jgi:hypothetical protein